MKKIFQKSLNYIFGLNNEGKYKRIEYFYREFKNDDEARIGIRELHSEKINSIIFNTVMTAINFGAAVIAAGYRKPEIIAFSLPITESLRLARNSCYTDYLNQALEERVTEPNELIGI